MTLNPQTLQSIRTQRVTLDNAESAHFNARAILSELDRQIAEFKRLGRIILQGSSWVAAPGDSGAQTLLTQRATAASNVTSRRSDVVNAGNQLGQLITSTVQGADPTVDIEQLPDDTPFVLMPVRVEYRFTPGLLKVRIIPDEISVEMHERELTYAERAAGEKFWLDVWPHAQGTQPERELWRAMVAVYGVPRASWIRKVMTPTNLSARQSATAPIFPANISLREGSWTRPPRVRTHPDRFVVTAYYQGVEERRIIGAPIPDPLPVGPDPLAMAALNPPGTDLTLEDSVRWLVDYDRALALGMAVGIPLNATQQTRGFDRLFVLGVRLSSDRYDAQARMERLFEGHHYRAGTEILRQGTPTNNTADTRSSYVSPLDTGDDGYEYEVLGNWSPASDVHEKNDAQRAAEAIGVDYSALNYLRNGTYAGARDAENMNRALFRATLGYYFDTLTAPNTSLAFSASLRKFSTRRVRGRGPLPALRIGAQPYGILLTSAFSKYAPSSQTLSEYSRIWAAVNTLDTFWTSSVSATPRVGTGGDVTFNTMRALGLHASSVELHPRYSMGERFLFEWLRFGRAQGSLAVAWRNAMTTLGRERTVAAGFNADDPPTASLLTNWRWSPRLTGVLVDKVSSETNGLSDTGSQLGNYLKSISQASVDALRTDEIGEQLVQNTGARPLLYMMMRQAILLELWEAAVRLHVNYNQWNEKTLRAEHPILNITTEPLVLRWDILSVQVPYPNVAPARPLQVLDQYHPFEGNDWFETRAALVALENVPTAELERLLIEHFDLCTYRLDAWKTGFYEERLAEMRGAATIQFPLTPPAPPPGRTQANVGIFLGAYGWLQNVFPRATAPVVVSASDTDLVALGGAAALPGSGSVIEYADNDGRIHAPSVTQAMTAAVLRSGHRRFKSTAQPNRFAVDLSSARVRRGLELIEGLRRGQSMEEMLGYRFERELHDRSGPGNELDQYILNFRTSFPLLANKVQSPQTGDELAALTGGNVVDGVALIAKVRTLSYPWTVTGLPAPASSGANAIIAAAAVVDDALDAFSDLCIAEGVHQSISSNYERVSATMDMMSRGGPSDVPNIVETPRSGRAIMNRLGVVFNDSGATNPWPAVAPTPRSELENRLNSWLASHMPDPDDVQVRVVLEPGGLDKEVIVRLSELGLQPIDVIAWCSDDLPSGTETSALELRIVNRARVAVNFDDGTPARIDWRWRDGLLGSNARTFFECMPLWRAQKKLLGSARALDATHLQIPQQVDGNALNPGGVDLTELAARVAAAIAGAELLRGELKDHVLALEAEILAESITPATMSAVRVAMLRTSDYGIFNAVPRSATASTLELARDLIMQLGEARSELIRRVQEATARANVVPGETSAQATARLIAAIQELFGREMRIFPRFNAANAVELGQTYGARLARVQNAPRPSSAVDEWLTGVRHVREDAGSYALQRLSGRMNGRSLRALAALQLPYVANTRWVGLPLGPEPLPPSPTLSLVLELPSSFTATAAHCGMMIDEWTELIPERTAVTGVALNYDQPASQPPQSILVVVPPVVIGRWIWNDLLLVLRDTFAEAEKRLVEPEQLESTPLAQFLPLIVAPFTKQNTTIGLRFADNIVP